MALSNGDLVMLGCSVMNFLNGLGVRCSRISRMMRAVVYSGSMMGEWLVLAFFLYILNEYLKSSFPKDVALGTWY